MKRYPLGFDSSAGRTSSLIQITGVKEYYWVLAQGIIAKGRKPREGLSNKKTNKADSNASRTPHWRLAQTSETM